MSRYKLNINFIEELEVTYATHQRLVLTKAVEGNMGEEVIWVPNLPTEHN